MSNPKDQKILTDSPDKNSLSFIKEVAKYFMDFLETDFHKRRNPKRSIQNRNSSNFLVGVNTGKYVNFNSQLGKLIAHAFEKNTLSNIQKGIYRTNIPENLLGLVKLQLDKITTKQISKIVEDLAREIEKAAALNLKEYDQAYNSALEKVSDLIKTKLVLPFVNNLEKPIENLDLGDEGSIYLMEEELTAVLVSLVENKIHEILKQILSQTKVNAAREIKDVFDTKEVKSSIVSFFENFQVGDLFAEIYEMERNRSILDKQEFYFYFCDITFNKAKYPIFYIPFALEKNSDILTIEFDSQIYINKKALEYVTQEYNRETGHHGSLQTITERIIYLAQFQEKENFREFLEKIMNEITNFFELDNKINVTAAETSVAKSLWVRASNNRYIALFDKSDEALVNDYEEILELLSSEDSVLAETFNTLIDDFIYNEPQRFNTEVSDEWDNTEVSERLVFSSPIPLNGEQLQILSAIKRKDCKYIIVEGPPGTGKSHTITAIIFDHILKDKSVLVLSDKKEALDVVENNITGTLNKVRRDKNFQNPILRLGKTGSTYSQILSTNSVENIKTHLRAVKKNHGSLETDISKLSNSLKEDLEGEALAYAEIDLEEIQELVGLESFFSENGFPIELSEEILGEESLAEDLQELQLCLKNLKASLVRYQFDYNAGIEVDERLLDRVRLSILSLETIEEKHREFLVSKDNQQIVITLNENLDKFTLSNKEIDSLEGYERDLGKSLGDIFEFEPPRQFSELDKASNNLFFFKKSIEDLSSSFGARLAVLNMQASFTDFNYKQVQWFIDEYENLKLPVVGYLFRFSKIEDLNNKFKKVFNTDSLPAPARLIRDLKEIQVIVEQIISYKSDLPEGLHIDLVGSLSKLSRNSKAQEDLNAICSSISKYKQEISKLKQGDWFSLFEPKDISELRNIKIAASIISITQEFNESSGGLGHVVSLVKLKDIFDSNKVQAEISSLKEYFEYLTSISENSNDIEYVLSTLEDYPEIATQMDINPESLRSFMENKLLDIDEFEYTKFIRFISLKRKIEGDFSEIDAPDYENQKKSIEQLVTAQMTYILDDQLINFYETNPSTARTLREIIRAKKRFPREEFLKLKKAFPCILAGIRDYAEFIPLEPEIFDLVIIDEASQVSIAQAFPALLRAKKILILGDKKQFSNVKSAQARSDTNREYLNSLKEVFVRNVSSEGSKMIKLDKFNIKTSILEFFEFIANYNTQLLKHFRGYKEIISYSNKYFYQDSLQVMKIRGKSIDDVLRFSIIKSDSKEELIQNTNSLEIEFIVSELKKLYEEKSKISIGIITPHTNQQKLLVETINKLPERDYLYEQMDLKIMTFDTCQGEERDTIFYSMVATEDHDRLWGIFISDLSSVDIEEEGKIKAQRLNVGLSRAKETMHFVLSKPVDAFKGSIGEALRHYANVLEDAKREKMPDETDHRSLMEPQVLNWFYQTDFYKKNKENLEFIPQFELGKYLQQLDRFYDHPRYKVDFLLVFNDELYKEHKIIIEYDGFREHFTNLDQVNSVNYKHYYSEEDLYRQKVLESYGYKFLRINKFNIGKSPVETLDERIKGLLSNKPIASSTLTQIHETIDGLENGLMRECPKCKEVRSEVDFRDSQLLTGRGRFCRKCKSKSKKSYPIELTRAEGSASAGTKCTSCGAAMILRKGRRGRFYGCSRFPYCRSTKKV